MSIPNDAVTEELHAIANAGGYSRRVRQLATAPGDTTYAKRTLVVTENPDPDPVAVAEVERLGATFRTVVPLSGGMDSATALMMAHQVGLNPIPLYVDTGAPYSDIEIDVCQSLILTLRELVGYLMPLQVVKPNVEFPTVFDFVTPCRNLIIVHQAARFMNADRREVPTIRMPNVGWGTIWFGNTSTWSETLVAGHDKSWRFFSDTQHILSHLGIDVQLMHPLAGLTKADIVAYWMGLGLVDVLAEGTRSCYDSDTAKHCGRCLCCFKRFLAFQVHDADHPWPNGWDWRAGVESFRAGQDAAARKTNNLRLHPEWHPHRIARVEMVVEALEAGDIPMVV